MSKLEKKKSVETFLLLHFVDFSKILFDFNPWYINVVNIQVFNHFKITGNKLLHNFVLNFHINTNYIIKTGADSFGILNTFLLNIS